MLVKGRTSPINPSDIKDCATHVIKRFAQVFARQWFTDGLIYRPMGCSGLLQKGWN